MRFWREEDGQDMIEYALLVAVVALTGGLALIPVAPDVATIHSKLLSLLRRY